MASVLCRNSYRASVTYLGETWSIAPSAADDDNDRLAEVDRLAEEVAEFEGQRTSNLHDLLLRSGGGLAEVRLVRRT